AGAVLRSAEGSLMPSVPALSRLVRLSAASLALFAFAACSPEPVVLLSVSVTPPDASIAAGTRQPFVALAAFSDGEVQDVTAQADWSLSDTSIARFVGEGGQRGVAEGTAAGTVEVS